MNLKIHHIGYLVKNLDKAISKFEHLGYEICSARTHDELRYIDIVFLKKDGYVIELVSPYDDNSVVSQLIKQYKNSPYHICYSTDDFDKVCLDLKAEKYTMIGEPLPAPAFGGKRVIFLMHCNIGMIELLEN